MFISSLLSGYQSALFAEFVNFCTLYNLRTQEVEAGGLGIWESEANLGSILRPCLKRRLAKSF
jgi:hypothetical protein